MSHSDLEMTRAKDVFALDDTLLTGTRLVPVISAIKPTAAHVVTGVIWNRGGVTADRLGVSCLVELVSREQLILFGYELVTYEPHDCPLCKAMIPFDK